MLTAEGCRKRISRLLESFESPPDWILTGDPAHQMYFANYHADPFVFRSVNSASVLLIGRDGSTILVADSMVAPFAKQAHVDRVVTPVWYDGTYSAPSRGPRLVESVLHAIRTEMGTSFGIEQSRLPAGVLEGLLAERPGAAIEPVDQIIHELKRRKDPDELALIRQSISAMEAGFAAARQDVRAGMTELDAFHIVERASRESLGIQAPIYGDFASGPRSSKGGGPPGLRRIEPGDLFLLDYSVVVYGYRGDFASTWVVDGMPTGEHLRLRDACFEAMKAGEAMLRDGAECRAIDRAVRASFAANGLDGNFKSHSGHGLGLGHPDPPYIVPQSDDVLVEGDVVTLEPSQSIEGLGTIRLEHNYLVTADGFEQLSNHSLALDAVEEPIQETDMGRRH